MRLALVCTLVALTARARAEATAPLATFAAPSSGFIDDAFAIRADGQAVAYVTTDGASDAALHLVELTGAKADVPGLPVTVVAVHWLTADRVLVVARDPAKGTVSGQVYTAKGATKEKLPAVDSIALATVADKPAVVTYARREKRGIDHLLVAYDRATWKVLGKNTLHADADGLIAHKAGPFKPLWWYDGFTVAAMLKAGEFDKARDMRRPDRFAHFDNFGNRVRDEREIEDLLAFARAGIEHAKHPGEELFVELSEDHRKVLLVDGLDENEVSLARPLPIYDSETLAYQALDAGRLALSMTVDPVNPEALKRQKAVPDEIDLYVVDRKTRAATVQLRLAGQGRPSAWRIAGNRLGLLRKSKGYDRGGVALEIYDLGGAQAAGR